MQKITYFQFQLGIGYGMRKMTALVWRVFSLLKSCFPDPYPSSPFVGQNDRKSSNIFVYGYDTWDVKSNGHMVGNIFGIRTDQGTPLFFGHIRPIGREVLVSLV